jgi:NAD(P)-dependent dehydrogenase (short-subunit alcohol dehydrogenase family)
MDIKNTVALVTGANRGLGRAFVEGLVLAGAKKVYAAARDPASIAIDGVERVALDVTDPAAVAALAQRAGDVTLLVNNAGIARGSAFLGPDAVAAARAELETNFFGPLTLARSFAPVLQRNGGGAIVNVLSVLSWLSSGGQATYSASKSAAWSLTNGLRNELRGQGTKVVALHVGYMDTDMASHVDGPKTRPVDVVRQVLDALSEGRDEVLADEVSRQVKQALSAGLYLQPR